MGVSKKLLAWQVAGYFNQGNSVEKVIELMKHTLRDQSDFVDKFVMSFCANEENFDTFLVGYYARNTIRKYLKNKK